MPSIVSFSRAATAVVACALAGLSASAQAQTAQTSANLAGWTFGYAPYTWHYSDAKKENEWEPDEQKHAYVWLLQAEKQLDERQLAAWRCSTILLVNSRSTCTTAGASSRSTARPASMPSSQVG